MKKYKSIIEYVVIIIIVVLIRIFICTPVQVDGTSMSDTLHDKDIMILNIASYYFTDIKRFDIVVIKYEDEYLVKRVVGLPGEKIEFIDNQLYVNDTVVEENFLGKEVTDDFSLEDIGYDTIPEDKYFVLGDNRDNSTDSRIIGLINRDDILGKTNLVIFPISHIGIAR